MRAPRTTGRRLFDRPREEKAMKSRLKLLVVACMASLVVRGHRRCAADRGRAGPHHAGREDADRPGAGRLREVREGEMEHHGQDERAGGRHTGRVRPDRRVERAARGRHLLGRRERAVRQARRAEAARDARSAEGRRRCDSGDHRQAEADLPQGPEGLLDRHRARAVRPRLSPEAAAASRRARAEGLGRPAQSEAQGQRRAVRADPLVAAATRPTR